MNYRRVGRSGLKISEIALGGWLTFGGSVDGARTERIVKAAIDQGVNFIDLSDIYARGEAEKVVGQAIRDCKRSDLVISTKLFWPMSDNVNDRGLSRKHIMESIDNSLRRIGVEYIDIYFCHRFDPDTEVEETVRAMDDLIRSGKILYWGTSVWTEAQIERAIGDADRFNAYRPIVEQPRYNMLDRHIEMEIIPVCGKYGLGLTVWSPLAQGLLTGKYNDGTPAGTRGASTEWLKKDLTDENIAKVRKLTALADSYNVKVSQLALAWALRLPEISAVLTGATDENQLKENIAASEFELSVAVVEKVEAILGGTVNIRLT
ncbi:MAG: aldo/keto reductase family protein [Candidatus Zixiibacteriota bacterium]